MSTAAQVPYLHLLRCPRCAQPLSQEDQTLLCPDCGERYPIEDGVPHLSVPGVESSVEEVGERVRAFYEENPFPDYEDFDSLASLLDKARKGVFAKLLDEQIPFGCRILECGCGTGQLSNFLGIAHRTVIGTDMTLNSLALARRFREQHQLERVFFLQMNLFRPCFPPASFDFVISNGVLHHTADARAGFASLARLVKPGGCLIAGLYHRYGRLATDLRRILFRLGGERWAKLDPRLRRGNLGGAKQRAWLADQYRNPHERKFTIGQSLKWLEPNGLTLVKTIPKTRLGEPFAADEELLEPEEAAGPLSRSLIEWGQALTGAHEGGFFILIARRKS